MRFLIGLFAGALTIFVGAWVLERSVSDAANAHAPPAFNEEQQPATAVEPVSEQNVAAIEVPADTSDSVDSGDDESDVSARPPATPPPTQIEAPSEVQEDPAEEPQTVQAEAMAATGPDSDSDLPSMVDSPTTQAVVWRPFHSEVSANGFARRLSAQLGVDFYVRRQEAAVYHVVFDYTSPEERELLQSQIAALTGFSPRAGR